jgi:hypothetical protein
MASFWFFVFVGIDTCILCAGACLSTSSERQDLKPLGDSIGMIGLALLFIVAPILGSAAGL